MEYFLPFLIAFVFSAAFTKLVLSFETDRRWFLRPPAADRWHRTATPTLGGIAMFASFVISILWFRIAHGDLVKILAGGTCIFALGLIDDLRPLPPYAK